jgi:hypothetical protein
MDSDLGPLDSDIGPLDSVSAMALVVRAIEDIDSSSEERRDVLLFDLLSAAWPDPTAQNQ